MAADGHLGDKPIPNLQSVRIILSERDSSKCIVSFVATDGGRAAGDQKNPAATPLRT